MYLALNNQEKMHYDTKIYLTGINFKAVLVDRKIDTQDTPLCSWTHVAIS